MLRLSVLALALLAAALPARAEDLYQTYSDASAQWLDGRPDDAEGALKYVVYRSTDTQLESKALLDLETLLAEEGKNGEALAYLAKGEVIDPSDFYVFFEKGWNLLSLEKYQDARAAFEKALTLTADPDFNGQARLGMALAEEQLGGPAASIEDLQTVYSRDPYLLAPASALISENYVLLKKRPYALTFLKEALTYDPRNFQNEVDLAKLYEDSDYQVPAWQTYYTLSDMDPDEGFFRKKVEKLRKYVKGRIDDMLYWARMAWPVHSKPMPQYGPAVKVGLYADKDGSLSLVKGFSFICTSDFELADTRLGNVAAGKAGMQWSVSYDEKNRVYQVRDAMNAVAHTTTNSIRIIPKVPGAIILIKNPDLPGAHGVDRGDKEVSGELLALVRDKGFWLINETRLENLVSPIAARLADDARLPEQLKAVAIAVRTRLTRLARLPDHESREYDLCDSAHCLPFPGLQAENDVSAEAARATRGEVLMSGSTLADVEFQRACGGFTESGVNDGGRPLPPMTPFNFYAYTLKGPPDGLLCLSDDKTTSSDVYWTLLLKPKWIEDRINRIKKVGYIRDIVPLKREPDGRIKSIRVDGTAGSAVIEGWQGISGALASGTLRSPLFSIRPIYKGKYPRFFILRGIGTGNGEGMCLLGARGMAQRLGSKYTDILKHYFPLYKVKKLL